MYEKKLHMMFNIHTVIHKSHWLICFGHIKNCMESGPISELYEYYSVIVPKIMSGDMKLMDRVIKDHSTGVKELCCLRSRSVYINASYHKISVRVHNRMIIIVHLIIYALLSRFFYGIFSWNPGIIQLSPEKVPNPRKKKTTKNPLQHQK